MEKAVVCFHIPRFLAVLEELRDPVLRRKSMVVAHPAPRSVVQAANHRAHRDGIRQGMLLAHARRLARNLHVVVPDPSYYRDRHQRLLRFLGRYSPMVEGVRPGRYFLDLTGTRRLWGPPSDAAYRLEATLWEECALPVRAGIAATRFISQVAVCHVREGELGCVFPGGEAVFLANLPVDALPGIGSKTAEQLRDLHVLDCGQLAALSPGMLVPIFGRRAFRILRLAQGKDRSPLRPHRVSSSLCLHHRLAKEEVDRNVLDVVLWDLAEEAGWRLRRRNRVPHCLRLRLQHADGKEVAGTKRFPGGIFPFDRFLFVVSRSLFHRIFLRRVALRCIHVEWSLWGTPYRQLPLWSRADVEFERERRLQEALDAVRDRYGRKAVTWACSDGFSGPKLSSGSALR